MLLIGSKKESTLNFYEQAGYNRKDKKAPNFLAMLPFLSYH